MDGLIKIIYNGDTKTRTDRELLNLEVWSWLRYQKQASIIKFDKGGKNNLTGGNDLLDTQLQPETFKTPSRRLYHFRPFGTGTDAGRKGLASVFHCQKHVDAIKT